MSRSTLRRRFRQSSSNIILCTLTILQVAIACQSVAQADDSVPRGLARLVQIAHETESTSAMEQYAQNLSRTSPRDARVPYTQALLLIEDDRFRDAVEPINQTLQLNPRNLNAWKTRIWLALIDKDYQTTMTKVAYLGSRMPQEDASPNRQRAGADMAEFFGQVVGFLDGPREGSLTASEMESLERLLALHFTASQSRAFERGRNAVMAEFNSRMAAVDELQAQGRYNESTFRTSQLARLSSEDTLTLAQLGELETLRAQDRFLKSNERNTIALSRASAVGGLYSARVDGYAANYRGLALRRNRRRPLRVVSRGSAAYRGVDRTVGGFAFSSGLGDQHVAATYLHGQAYDEYLARREYVLRRRLRFSTKREEDLLRKPITGSSPGLRMLTEKTKSVQTYIALPINPAVEIENMLTSTPTRGSDATRMVSMNRRNSSVGKKGSIEM